MKVLELIDDLQGHIIDSLRIFKPNDLILKIQTPEQAYKERNEEQVKAELTTLFGEAQQRQVDAVLSNRYRRLKHISPKEWDKCFVEYNMCIFVELLSNLMIFCGLFVACMWFMTWGLSNNLGVLLEGPNVSYYYDKSMSALEKVFWLSLAILDYGMRVSSMYTVISTMFKIIRRGVFASSLLTVAVCRKVYKVLNDE